MGSQRADLSLRRASRLALRQQQMQDVQRLLEEAIREREQVVNDDGNSQQESSQQNQNHESQGNQIQGDNQNVNIVISEHQEEEEDSNPYGLEF
jgi:hypothetical protein